MYHYFTNKGYKVKIIKGNLALVNENFLQCDHVWVWVKSGGYDYAYDWGYYYTDDQHYYGYEVSYRELLAAAAEDQ
jgi:hypothetical protein